MVPALVVLALVLFALVAFWTEAWPIEVTSLAVVAALAASGVLTPGQAFAGFANETVIFIFTLLAMSQGLAAAGVVQLATRRLSRVSKLGRVPFLLVTLATVAAFSAFVSNTVTTAAFLPVVVAASGRAGLDKHEILLPMAFASMLGGTITLFGTSTNLVMSAVMERAGLGGIAPFELAPIGLPVTAAAIVVLALVAPRLLRTPGAERADEALFAARKYLSELHVPADSPEHGKALGDVTAALPMRVLGVVREGEPMPPDAEHVLRERDRIVVEGHPEALAQAQSIAGVELPSPGAEAGRPPDTVLVEAAVPIGSPLVGRTLEEARLPLRYGLEPMALHRHPTLHRLTKVQLLSLSRGPGSITRLPLAVGDVLLLRGPAARVRELGDGTTLLVLTGVAAPALRPRRAGLAAALFVAALAAGAAGIVPLAVAGLTGLLAMIVTGCVEVRRAFAIDWRVVLLIASMMALALAMEESGAARLVGDGVAWLAGFGGPRSVLAVLVALTIVLSIPMSNQAAALVVFPIALSVAGTLNVDPRTFGIGVTFAASCSLVTPLEPSAMLVYGAGRYRFADFLRVGGPLTAALVVVLTFAVPLVWPFSS